MSRTLTDCDVQHMKRALNTMEEILLDMPELFSQEEEDTILVLREILYENTSN